MKKKTKSSNREKLKAKRAKLRSQVEEIETPLDEVLDIMIHEDDPEDIVVHHKNRATTFLSVNALARELDIIKPSVNKIIARGDLKIRRQLKLKGASHGLYRLREFFKAFIEVEGVSPNAFKKAGPGRPKTPESEKEAAHRLTTARADKAELELALKTGAVHHEEDIIRDVGDMLAAFRGRMLGIPSKAAAVIPPEFRSEVEAEVRKIVHEGLVEISEYRPKLHNSSRANGSASAGTGSESVGGSLSQAE